MAQLQHSALQHSPQNVLYPVNSFENGISLFVGAHVYFDFYRFAFDVDVSTLAL